MTAPDNPAAQPRISGILLNWCRPANVERIVRSWEAGGLVKEAIVWNNNPATHYEDRWATVVNCSRDLGLYTRFAAASLAQHPCVFIQDDDLLVGTETLAALHEAWRRDPDILHGLIGRRPAPDGSYQMVRVTDGAVPVVLTRALLTHRRHVDQFFSFARAYEDLQKQAAPEGNGEDILFSYSVLARNGGRPHRVYPLAFEELEAPNAISRRDRARHLAHRDRLLRACSSPPPLAGP